MCRSIKVLRRPEGPATRDEIAAAARQYVRKVSGFPKPSKKNEAAFERAVAEIAAVTERLLGDVRALSCKDADRHDDAGRAVV